MASSRRLHAFDFHMGGTTPLMVQFLGVEGTSNLICTSRTMNAQASVLICYAFISQAREKNDAWQANAIKHMLANGMKDALLTAVRSYIVGPFLAKPTDRVNHSFVRRLSPLDSFMEESVDSGELVGVACGKGAVDVVKRLLLVASDEPNTAEALRCDKIAAKHVLGGMQLYSITGEKTNASLTNTLRTMIGDAAMPRSA